MASCIENIEEFFNGMDEASNLSSIWYWAMIWSPLHNGGLGTKDLRHFYQALLGKLLWRQRIERVVLVEGSRGEV